MPDQGTSNLLPSLVRWHSGLLGLIDSDLPDLANRQTALLLIICLKTGPHTVRGLAGHLTIAASAVSRALNHLGEIGYIRRIPDEADRRNVFIVSTSEGSKFVDQLAVLWHAPLNA